MSDEIQPLIDDACAAVRRGAGSIPPDFAAVIARVRELAPHRACAPAPLEDPAVIDIRGGDRGTPAVEAALDDLFADTRASLQRLVGKQRMRSIPLLPTPPRRRPTSRYVAGAMLVAAAVALSFGGYRIVDQARHSNAEPAAEQAFHLEATDRDESGEMEIDEADRNLAPRRPSVPELAPAPLETTIATPPMESRKTVVRKAAGLGDDRMRTLAAEAQALWRKGDLRGAEQRFEAITKNGARSVHAELAWADLFALARQLGDGSRRTARWKAYLAAFPRGRFVDDARAGLCRTAKDTNCWRAYLRDLPKGSYRGEAESALLREGAP